MSCGMSRREFTSRIALMVASETAIWQPCVSFAQQTVLPRIGVLMVAFSLEGNAAKQFRLGLRDAGYVDGRNITIEWRSASGDYTRIPQLAADLIHRQVDVIVVDSTPGVRGVKDATSSLPIVMAV